MMLSSDETGYDTSGSIMRAARAANRRELLKSKRTRNTEMLPGVNEEDTRMKAPRSPVSHLREENVQLRREIEDLQEQLATYQSSMDLLDGEIETIHRDHQQELEQYQQNIREMMDELNQMQEANRQLELRYQELYHAFQDEVDREANKLVKEATQTLILSPEHTPALLSDVVKTLEAQVKQTEDQQTMQMLSMMRQAQYKSELLEQEVARERTELANEREALRLQREDMVQEAQQRYRIEQTRLRARWSSSVMLISLLTLGLLVALEMILYRFSLPLAVDLFLPLLICMGLTYIMAHLHTTGRVIVLIKGKSARAGAGKKGEAKKGEAKKEAPKSAK